jgi:Domain of unknown function (DUF4389)
VTTAALPRFEADFEASRSRLTTFFRLLLAIPHLLVLWLWGIAAAVVVFVAWFALVVTGRYPQAMYDFVAAYLRFSTFVHGYAWLLCDPYPPFTGDASERYPVRLLIGPPLPAYDRLKTGFRFLLAIPVLVIVYAMQIVYQLGALLAWFAIVVTGRQPRGLQDMIVLGLSYQQRAYAYLALVSEDWPAFTDPQPRAVRPPAPFGALPPTGPGAGRGSAERPAGAPPDAHPEAP